MHQIIKCSISPQQVVDVILRGGPTDATTVVITNATSRKSTLLNWWDILFLALGCVAVVTGPVLIITAVSLLLVSVCDSVVCIIIIIIADFRIADYGNYTLARKFYVIIREPVQLVYAMANINS